MVFLRLVSSFFIRAVFPISTHSATYIIDTNELVMLPLYKVITNDVSDYVNLLVIIAHIIYNHPLYTYKSINYCLLANASAVPDNNTCYVCR
jgi:hypothetical protein